MLLKNRMCADAGTSGCPCYLAEFGKCIVCSRLGGRGTHDTVHGRADGVRTDSAAAPETCGCQWQGVCIYNEYMQNNLCIKERRSRQCEIQKIKWFDDDLAVMRISVPRGMAERAGLPGSFVFVRPSGTENWFDFPVSVLRSDYEGSTIEIAVRAAGPKSRALLERGLEFVKLRGIYRNGLLGVEKLLDPAPKRVLCLTKGVGIAPAANYIRWSEGRHHIDVIADLDKINREFAEAALGVSNSGGQAVPALPVNYGGVDSVEYGPLPLNLSWAEEDKYDVILICASDYYQQNIYVPEAKKVLSNNTSMCCGEGVCGACICMDAAGKEHRMCKECDGK